MVPHRRVKNARIGRIQAQIRRAGIGADFQHVLPGFAAIGGAENTALFIRRPDLPLYGNPGDIGIGRVDFYLCDLAAFLETDMCPGLAGIGGFPHTVTGGGGHAPDGCFTGADIQHIVVGLGHRDRTNGTDLEILIRNIGPRSYPHFPFSRHHHRWPPCNTACGLPGTPATVVTRPPR